MVEAFVEHLEALTYEVSRCADALDALAAEARREETKRQRTEAQERAAGMPQDLLSSDEPDF